MDDELIAGLPSCCGPVPGHRQGGGARRRRQLDAAEFTSALDAVAGGRRDPCPAGVHAKGSRIGVVVEADGPIAARIAGTDAVAAADGDSIEVKEERWTAPRCRVTLR